MKVYTSTQLKAVRGSYLGLGLGMIWIFLVLVFRLLDITADILLMDRLAFLWPWSGTGTVSTVVLLLWGFVLFGLLGWLMGIIYNQLARWESDRDKKPLFEISFAKNYDILTLKDNKEGDLFTVVLVANPAISKQNGNPVRDPMILDKDLFVKTITHVFKSFTHNELLSLPEILSRIRFVSVFDNTAHQEASQDPAGTPRQQALCGELVKGLTALKPTDNNLVETYVKDMLKGSGVKTIDVIYVLTASVEFTRSSALFSQCKKTTPGKKFKFSFGPGWMNPKPAVHTYRNTLPGVIALSAWEDRLHVPVHEFAHAVSTEVNGAIVDEYIDDYTWPPGSDEIYRFKNAINVKHRDEPPQPKLKMRPVPKKFATYSRPTKYGLCTTIYDSDRYRSDKDPGWVSYVPCRDDITLSCIMDVCYYGCRFDNLLHDFLYDLLMVKINR
ncbi:hypothetical protein JW935_02245 [candidate division KSB1 bacterium]|nr:hypothetical protein [candidate division KSB1 bacterium]